MDKMNPDIAVERQNPSFNVEEMTNLFDGGAEKTEIRRKIVAVMQKEPLMEINHHTEGREGQYVETLQRTLRFLQMCKENKGNGLHNLVGEEVLRYNMYIGAGMANYLHYSMFLPTIQVQATDEQKERWLPLATKLKMLGTYAQTEMAHGSNVRGLETTAVFDPSTQEFVLNTPALSSYKWWPGFLGHTSNHILLAAQLITRGKNHGVHFFLVQIRSMEDHTPLPGVNLGDIGPSMGMNGVNNGYLCLKNVRIPRTNMLMRFFQVDPDGNYKVTGNPKVLYGTMVLLRKHIAGQQWALAGKALTIAIRYSCVRRQGKSDNSNTAENKVMDYQTQQHYLLPGLASVYAQAFTKPLMDKMYDRMSKEMNQGNFDTLPELHATLSCLKASNTWTGLRIAELCRLCCGGHGFSLASGIPTIYSTVNAACTYEGDNTVMCLQTSRFLIKSLAKARAGKPLPQSVQYLMDQDIQEVKSFPSNMFKADLQVKMFQQRARRLVIKVAKKIEKHVASGKTLEQAWNITLVEQVQCAKAHAQSLIVAGSIEGVRNVSASAGVKTVLKNLSDLHVLHNILEDLGSFLEAGCIEVVHIEPVRSAVFSLLDKIRPDAVALVDAFDFTDQALASALGCYDGNAYEHLFERAQKGAMNKQEVHPSYHKYLKPIMDFHSKL